MRAQFVVAVVMEAFDGGVLDGAVHPHGLQQVLQELPGGSPVGLVDELGDGELAGAVDGDEQVELSLGSLHLGDIHVEKPIG